MKIESVRKDGSGNIQMVKLDDGRELSKDEAISLVENGNVEGVEVRSSKNGSRYLRSIPDSDKGNNLDNLPQF